MAIDRKALFASLSKGASGPAPDEPVEGDDGDDSGGDDAGKQLLAAIAANDAAAVVEAVKAIVDE